MLSPFLIAFSSMTSDFPWVRPLNLAAYTCREIAGGTDLVFVRTTFGRNLMLDL